MHRFADAMLKKVAAFAFMWLFFMFFMFSSSEQSGKDDGFIPPHTRIVAFGDSLTAGYNLPLELAFPAHLQEILQSKGYDVEVVNQGISGDTTGMALRRLSRVLELKPDIVILEFGANDVLKRQSIPAARENLIFMIEKMKENGIKVLLAGLLPPEYFPVAFSEKDFYLDIAKETDVLLYPNFMQGIYDNRTAPANLVMADNVHPTAEGAKLMAENITPFVERTIQAFYQQVRENNKLQ